MILIPAHSNRNGKYPRTFQQRGTRMQMKRIQEGNVGMEKIMGPLGAFLNRFQMDRRHSRRWKPVSFLPFSFLYLAAPPRIRKVAFDRSCQLVPEKEPSSSSSSSTCSSSSLSKKRGEMLTRRFVTFLIFFSLSSTFFIFRSFRTIW